MKGFWYIIESVMAGILVITFLIAVGGQTISTPPEENLEIKAFDILKGMEEQGILRNHTVNEDVSTLNSRVKLYNYNHTIQICRPDGSCVGTAPNVENMWVGTYLISGDNTYKPYEVKLYIW